MPASFEPDLAEPVFLLGLLSLPLLVWYFYRSLVDFARWQRLGSLVCRGAILVLVVLGLAGLALLQPSQEQFVVFIVDQSRSIGPQARRVAEEFLDRALAYQGTNQAAFLAFAV